MGNVILFLSNHSWILITCFTIVQLICFVDTLKKLHQCSKFFPEKKSLSISGCDNSYVIHVSEGTSGFKDLVDEINEYLDKNEGTTDFSIIKDKVENKIDALYEDAVSKVSFPTFFGLAGTFLGAWIGLYSFRVGVETSASGVTDEIISALIGGVIISMITSFVGLVLMIFGNWCGNIVQKRIGIAKSEFFDFVQVNLIPVLGTSMVSALNKLHHTINTFEPAFRGVIEEFKTAFNDCTETLRGAFGSNVKLLTDAVETMGRNMSEINKNVMLQEQLLNTMQQSRTLNTLEKFSQAADKFGTVTESIDSLAGVKDEIVRSSAELVEVQSRYMEQMSVPERVFGKVNAILDRVSTFESSVNALGESISRTQLLGNTEMNLIEEQLSAIERKTSLAVRYQEIADEELEKLYEEQAEAISELNSKYRSVLDRHADDFEAAMLEFRKSFEEIVGNCKAAVEAKRDEYIKEITKSLDLEAKNQHLAQLEKMQDLVSTLSSIRSSVERQPDTVQKLIDAVTEQIASIMRTLDSMDGKLDRAKSAGRAPVAKAPKRRVFLKIFRRNRQ